MNTVKRAWRWLERHAEESLAGVCICVMTILVFFQVVMRYVFHKPTSWSDEIAIYAMLWSVYLSMSWAVRERAHIRVMNLINAFPKKVSLRLTIFSDAIWFAFSLFLTYQSVLLDLTLWEQRFESPVLGISQKWPYLCLVFGFGLMSLRLVQVYYRWIRHGEPLMPDEPTPGAEDSLHG